MANQDQKIPAFPDESQSPFLYAHRAHKIESPVIQLEFLNSRIDTFPWLVIALEAMLRLVSDRAVLLPRRLNWSALIPLGAFSAKV